MGTEVYEVMVRGENSGRLRAYAQSAPSGPGGAFTMLLIHIDPQRSARVRLSRTSGTPAREYEITSGDIFGQQVLVNGQELRVGEDGSLPDLSALARPVEAASEIAVHPLSYTFLQWQP